MGEHAVGARDQRELGLQLRREMAQVRAQILDGAGAVAKSAEENAVANMAPIIEAKFAQLDGFLVQLQAGLTTLGAREDKVEQIMQAQHDEKPHHEEIISGAFGHMDQKISQVSELVRKFDGTLIPSSSPAAVFTKAMQQDMEKMHTQLKVLSPVLDQISEVRVKILSQDECLSSLEAKIVTHTEVLTALHGHWQSADSSGSQRVDNTAGRCATCGPSNSLANPWSHAPAAPGVPGAGMPGSSGEGDPLAILRAVIGGNNICHCVHVTELQDKVAALERAAIARAPSTGFQPDPWARGPSRGDGAPGPRGGQEPTTTAAA